MKLKQFKKDEKQKLLDIKNNNLNENIKIFEV